MQQLNSRLLRHPITGELPVGFRQPRLGRGEVGPQPFYRIAGGDPTNDDDDPPADDDEKKFTQKDLNAKLTEEKRQGKRAATREIMEKFGFDSMEEAEAFLTAAREREKADQSEADRKAAEAEADRKAAEKEKADAAAERRNATIERTLVRLGVDTGDEDDDDDEGDLPDALALITRDLDADADADDIRAAAKALKERRPELFGGNSTEEKPTPKKKGNLPGGKPGGRTTPPGVKPGAGGLAAAKRRGFISDKKD